MNRIARLCVYLRLERLLLAASSRVLHFWNAAPVLGSLGWHLGHLTPTSRASLMAKTETGGKVRINVREFAHRKIYLHGQYEEGLTAFLRSIATRGWTFFDVGANIGFFSVLACDLGGRGSRSVCFEPNPRLFPYLEAARPESGELIPVPMAVGGECGRLQLTLSDDERNSGLSSLLEREGERVEVEVTTLDVFAAQGGYRPNAIKVDTEGTGLQVLQGAKEVLADRALRAVACEMGPQSDSDAILALMRDVDFAPYQIDGQRLRPFSQLGKLEDICFLRK